MGSPGSQHAGQSGREAALHVVRVLRQGGHVSYFAGGCVRDELLGLVPADYDVATDATPDRVSALFRRTAHVGAHFGVVLVKPPTPRTDRHSQAEEHVIEVATFRSDGAYSDRRRPDSITFSDARSDAQRRDFTVNALFLDPAEAGGEAVPDSSTPGAITAPTASSATPGDLRSQVVDFVGGLADLDARVLRAVGDPDARLAEDHLRALRAVRLAARLGFTIEASTAAAISAHARDLAGVSPERIGDEMRRMLAHPTRSAAVASLQRLGLDAPVLGSANSNAVLGRLNGLAASPPAGIGECLAAIGVDRGDITGPGEVQTVLTRWRRTLCLSNDEREAARQVLDSYFTLRQDFTSASVARQKRWAVRQGFAGGLRLIEVENPDLAQRIRITVVELERTASGLAPTALVTGDDLIAVGMTPGPGFAGLLARVYDAQLEDLFDTREGGLRLARQLVADGSTPPKR